MFPVWSSDVHIWILSSFPMLLNIYSFCPSSWGCSHMLEECWTDLKAGFTPANKFSIAEHKSSCYPLHSTPATCSHPPPSPLYDPGLQLLLQHCREQLLRIKGPCLLVLKYSEYHPCLGKPMAKSMSTFGFWESSKC